jgi:hypothetical protein
VGLGTKNHYAGEDQQQFSSQSVNVWVGVPVTPMTRIWQMFSSNLDRDTNYPHFGFYKTLEMYLLAQQLLSSPSNLPITWLTIIVSEIHPISQLWSRINVSNTIFINTIKLWTKFWRTRWSLPRVSLCLWATDRDKWRKRNLDSVQRKIRNVYERKSLPASASRPSVAQSHYHDTETLCVFSAVHSYHEHCHKRATLVDRFVRHRIFLASVHPSVTFSRNGVLLLLLLTTRKER